jgi:hypothetical protein
VSHRKWVSSFFFLFFFFRNSFNAESIEDELEDELLADENVTPIERIYGFRENDALINRQV